MRPCPRDEHIVRGKLFKLAAVLSLLLCAATVAAWVESYSIQRELIWNSTIDFDLVSNHGLFRVARWDWFARNGGKWHRQPYNEVGVFSCETRSYTGGDAVSPAQGPSWRVGFGEDHHPFGDGVEQRHWVTLPYWFLACALGACPALRAWRIMHNARRVPGSRCRTCGYDLRATPDRCPECGTPVVKAGR